MKSKPTDALDLVTLCCRVLDDKKAEALTVLDVSAQSSITDYLVLATATSEPHLRALRVELEKTLDARGARLVGMDAFHQSGWIVIDVFDVMVHLFLAQTREHYALERLWQDAVEVPFASLAAPLPAGRTSPKRAPTKRSSKSGGPSAEKKRTRKSSS